MAQRSDDSVDLSIAQFRIHRQRHEGVGASLADREVAPLVAEAGVGFLQVDRNRVVDAGGDAALAQLETTK